MAKAIQTAGRVQSILTFSEATELRNLLNRCGWVAETHVGNCCRPEFCYEVHVTAPSKKEFSAAYTFSGNWMSRQLEGLKILHDKGEGFCTGCTVHPFLTA